MIRKKATVNRARCGVGFDLQGALQPPASVQVAQYQNVFREKRPTGRECMFLYFCGKTYNAYMCVCGVKCRYTPACVRVHGYRIVCVSV